MRLTIFSASCVGNTANTIYPNKAVITNKDDMISAIARDHVCAEFKKAHRSIADFISSDVEVMDCDNDHSDNPKDWITPEKYEELFPDVSYLTSLFQAVAMDGCFLAEFSESLEHFTAFTTDDNNL